MLAPFVLEGIPLFVFWLFVGLAIIGQGIAKSGFGGGVSILTIPLMMLVMPVEKVAAVLLPLLILLDLNAILHHRHNKVWRKIFEIYFPATFGILAGTLVWWWIGREGIDNYAASLKRFVGVVAVFFSLYIAAKDRAMAWALRFHLGKRSAWALGLFSGFSSTLAHAAGPTVALYMFAQNMGKSLFVGTTAWTFALINWTKLPLYVAVDLIDREILLFDVALVWLIPIGSFLGKWLHDRISERLFNRVIMVLVMLAGIQLVSNTNLVLLFLERVVRPWLA